MRKKNGDASNEMEPQTIDGKTGKPDPTPPNPNLSNARDLRLEMARLYRQWLRKELDSVEMNKGIWALGEMLKAYEVQEIERRIIELEAQNLPNGNRALLPNAARAH
jgi:hypothetical protein